MIHSDEHRCTAGYFLLACAHTCQDLRLLADAKNGRQVIEIGR